MKLSEIIDMYKPKMAIPFSISVFIYFLYMILQLIDLNSVIKSMDVLDVKIASRTTIVFGYISAYFMFFFKIIIQLLSLVVLLTIIIWIITCIAHLVNGGSVSDGGGAYQSAAAKIGGDTQALGNKLFANFFEVVTYVMGVFFLRNFFMIFLIVIPIFFLFFLIMFVQFYDRETIVEKDEEKASRVTLTNHNFLMMIITTLLVFGVLRLTIDYFYVIIDQVEEMMPE